MVWIGTISYSLYVWHMPFFNPAAGIPFPLNLLLAFAAASACYYLLEQPILRARKRCGLPASTESSRGGYPKMSIVEQK
jgi:peptidoglycan/LPS O-acetylase OafA/YrhL